MTVRGALALLAACLVVVTAPAVGAAATEDAPLRVEDVVRLHVAGVPAGDLVRRIERAAVAFDLSAEMLAELRAAGLPSEVIDAMLARQRQTERRERSLEVQSPPEPRPAGPVGAGVSVRLFGARRDAAPPIRVSALVDARLAERLLLEPGDHAIDGIALYLACTRAEHVPDHWRAASPLGRDFSSMPRHRLLAFVTASEPVEADPADRADRAPQHVLLAVPERIEAELPLDGPHELALGLAVRIGGRYYRITDDVRADAAAAEGTALALEATLVAPRVAGSLDYEIRFVPGGP